MRKILIAALIILLSVALPVSTSGAGLDAQIVNPLQAYGYEQMLTDAVALQRRYPELIRLETVGSSVEGRNLLLIRFGTGGRSIFVDGTMHASAYICTAYIMYMLDQYAQAYETSGVFGDFNLREIFSAVTFCVVPMVNPDGVNLVQNGPGASLHPEALMAMAERDRQFGGFSSWKANIRGVDLNRNFDNNWDVARPVTAPASRLYKGDAPLSEPESLAVRNFIESTMCWAFVNFHSAGDGIYGWDDQNAVYYPQLKTMVSRIEAYSGYQKLTDTPETDYGTFAGYVRDTFLKPAITLELGKYMGSAPFPDNNFFSVWEPAKYICLIAAQEVMKMAPQEYLVFQNGEFKQAFCDGEFAAKYAGVRQDSIVLHIPGGIDALPSGQAVKAGFLLNGRSITLRAYAIGGSTYVKLRDLAALLNGSEKQFAVGYDPAIKEVTLMTGRPYLSVGGELAGTGGTAVAAALPSQWAVSVDNHKTALTAYIIGGSNYVGLRDLGRVMDFGVTWDGTAKTIHIDTATGYSE